MVLHNIENLPNPNKLDLTNQVDVEVNEEFVANTINKLNPIQNRGINTMFMPVDLPPGPG